MSHKHSKAKFVCENNEGNNTHGEKALQNGMTNETEDGKVIGKLKRHMPSGRVGNEKEIEIGIGRH
jgi:hypothetical protein